MVTTDNKRHFQYMKHCPVDNRPLGQTKVCPEHSKSKSTCRMTFNISIDYIPTFVDPAMA